MNNGTFPNRFGLFLSIVISHQTLLNVHAAINSTVYVYVTCGFQQNKAHFFIDLLIIKFNALLNFKFQIVFNIQLSLYTT